MKLSEILQVFGDFEVNEFEFKKILEKKDRVFEPKENEVYWYVSDLGKARSFIHNNDDVDEAIMSLQQVYRTRAEAEFARDKAIFLEFMRKEFLRNSDEINWKDVSQYKYYLLYIHSREEIDFSFNQSIQGNHMHTTNIEWLKIFIDDHYDEIKKYYFEVVELYD